MSMVAEIIYTLSFQYHHIRFIRDSHSPPGYTKNRLSIINPITFDQTSSLHLHPHTFKQEQHQRQTNSSRAEDKQSTSQHQHHPYTALQDAFPIIPKPINNLPLKHKHKQFCVTREASLQLRETNFILYILLFDFNNIDFDFKISAQPKEDPQCTD